MRYVMHGHMMAMAVMAATATSLKDYRVLAPEVAGADPREDKPKVSRQHARYLKREAEKQRHRMRGRR